MTLTEEITHDEVALRSAAALEAKVDGLRAGLLRLRSITSPAALLQSGAVELVESCGFGRVVVSRVAGDELILNACYASSDPSTLDQLLGPFREHPPVVGPGFHEGEILRRRVPVLAMDAQTHPSTYKPIMNALDIRAYVAAPVTVAGHAIAIIHADRPSGVDEVDRAILAAFAEGLAMALDRCALTDRIRFHEARMRELFRTGVGLVDTLVEDTVNFTTPAPLGEQTRATHGDPRERGPAAGAGTLSLLTPREIEVLEMIASGATNVAIGEALYITEVTVKSHVQHILRKLRVANRAEAAGRYMRATARH